MAIEFGAIGALTQGVARLLGLSKTARLRRAINDHVKLHASLSSHDDLKQAASRVAVLIDVQASQLVGREIAAARRVYDWANLASASFSLHCLPPHYRGCFRLMGGGSGS